MRCERDNRSTHILLSTNELQALSRPVPPGPKEYPVIGALNWVLRYRDCMLDGLIRGFKLVRNLNWPQTYLEGVSIGDLRMGRSFLMDLL